MKIVDNSPITEPAVGTFLSTNTPVWQLEPNSIYILSHASAKIKEEVEKVWVQLIVRLTLQDCVNRYRIVVLDESLDRDYNDSLSEALTGNRYDLVMPMARPSKDDYQYLFVKAEKGRLLDTLALMCYTAERVTKDSLVEATIKALKENPEGVLEILSPAFESKEFNENLITSGLSVSSVKPSFGALPSAGMTGAVSGLGAWAGVAASQLSTTLMDLLNIKPTDTEIQKNNKIYSQLDKILEHQTKHPEDNIGEAVRPIFANLPGEYLWRVFEENSKGTKDSNKYYDPTYYAKESTLRLNVVKRTDEKEYFLLNPRKHTDGLYVLFMANDTKKEKVHFHQRAHFIVYLIYLLDRVERKDEVTPIKLEDKEVLYKRLYDVVYPRDGQRDSSYFALASKCEKDGKRKRTPKFKDALTGIHKSIVESCRNLNEFEGTHYIHNSKSHLYTLPDRINIHSDLLEIAKACKKDVKAP